MESIEYSPEHYQLLSWLGAENAWKGTLPEAPYVPVEERENERLTREAVEAGVYRAEDVGM